MTITLKLLPALLLAGAAASTQQTAYDFKIVLRPESEIGGSNFRGDSVGSAAINDEGEVAFIIHRNGYAAQNAVFTLRRLVAKEGDSLDYYGTITRIVLNGRLAISPHGIVAFEGSEGAAFDTDIFVERRALIEASAAQGKELFLNEQDEPVIFPRKADREAGPFAMVPRNHRGQFVIAINTTEGPYLIVGTPK